MSDNKTRIIGRTQHVDISSRDNNKTVAIDTQSFDKVACDSGNNVNENGNIAGTRILGDVAYVDPNLPRDDGKTKLVRPRRDSSAAPLSNNLSNTKIIEEENYNPAVGWVTIIDGNGKGRSFELKHGYSFVGRDVSQEVCLNFGDDSISKEKHIKFLYDDQDKCFYVTAGESRNLGRINGKLFDGLTAIKNYDRIKIGNTELLFIALCSEEFSW